MMLNWGPKLMRVSEKKKVYSTYTYDRTMVEYDSTDVLLCNVLSSLSLIILEMFKSVYRFIEAQH